MRTARIIALTALCLFASGCSPQPTTKYPEPDPYTQTGGAIPGGSGGSETGTGTTTSDIGSPGSGGSGTGGIGTGSAGGEPVGGAP